MKRLVGRLFVSLDRERYDSDDQASSVDDTILACRGVALQPKVGEQHGSCVSFEQTQLRGVIWPSDGMTRGEASCDALREQGYPSSLVNVHEPRNIETLHI